MIRIGFICFLTLIFMSSCSVLKMESNLYESEFLTIKKLTRNTYIHTSYLNSEEYGKVACNGLIVMNKGEALVLDTPTDDVASSELIYWITETKQAEINAVIPTHFHVDCLGGLNEFHENRVPSYAYEETIKLAMNMGGAYPRNEVDELSKFAAGKLRVTLYFPGAGHTSDNVVGYVDKDKVLFGGCLVKSMNSGKGNLEDANEEAWPGTIKNIQREFPKIRYVVPGHGKPGGNELLEYTIEMFSGEL